MEKSKGHPLNVEGIRLDEAEISVHACQLYLSYKLES